MLTIIHFSHLLLIHELRKMLMLTMMRLNKKKVVDDIIIWGVWCRIICTAQF